MGPEPGQVRHRGLVAVVPLAVGDEVSLPAPFPEGKVALQTDVLVEHGAEAEIVGGVADLAAHFLGQFIERWGYE